MHGAPVDPQMKRDLIHAATARGQQGQDQLLDLVACPDTVRGRRGAQHLAGVAPHDRVGEGHRRVEIGAPEHDVHVVVRELALPVEVVCVALTDPDAPHRRINPTGRVPTLDIGEPLGLTENTAILPFLADLVPGTPLFAPAGSVERVRIQAWLGYLATEVHAGSFRAINRPQRYHPAPVEHGDVRTSGLGLLAQAMTPVADTLRRQPWLTGEHFTIADVYLGVFCGWIEKLGERYQTDTVLFDYGPGQQCSRQ